MVLLIEYRYLASYAIAKLWRILGLPFDPCSLLALRLTNLLVLCFVVPSVTSNLYQLLHPGSSEEELSLASVLASFPLLSFYGNLYYTDVLSTTLVLCSYLCALKSRYALSGLVSDCPKMEN